MELDARNLGDSQLQDDIAHWAEVLDRWVKGVDTRLGRDDSGLTAPQDEAEGGQGAGH